MKNETREALSDQATWLRLPIMLLFFLLLQVATPLLIAVSLVAWLMRLFTGQQPQGVIDFGQTLGEWFDRTSNYLCGGAQRRPFPFEDHDCPSDRPDEYPNDQHEPPRSHRSADDGREKRERSERAAQNSAKDLADEKAEVPVVEKRDQGDPPGKIRAGQPPIDRSPAKKKTTKKKSSAGKKAGKKSVTKKKSSKKTGGKKAAAGKKSKKSPGNDSRSTATKPADSVPPGGNQGPTDSND